MELIDIKPEIEKLPGGWEPNFAINLNHSNDIGNTVSFEGIHIFQNLLSSDECDEIVKQFMQSPNFEKVSIQGRKDVPDDRIGSIRTTAWCPQFAKELWDKKISSVIFKNETFTRFSPTDWWQDNNGNQIKPKKRTYKTIGVSPMMRFMKYEKDGQHYAHYDAAYIYPNDKFRTLYSMVIYLTTNDLGGSTRFIYDSQYNVNIWERNHDDWTREAVLDEVLFSSKPVKGNVLIFPHRMCHDVEKYFGDAPRIIIRGDILFELIS